MTPSNTPDREAEHQALERLRRLLEVVADLLSEAAELGGLPASIRTSVLTLMRETARLEGGVEWIVERVVVLGPESDAEASPRIETEPLEEAGHAAAEAPSRVADPEPDGSP